MVFQASKPEAHVSSVRSFKSIPIQPCQLSLWGKQDYLEKVHDVRRIVLTLYESHQEDPTEIRVRNLRGKRFRHGRPALNSLILPTLAMHATISFSELLRIYTVNSYQRLVTLTMTKPPPNSRYDLACHGFRLL